jgi:hypothetical protein
MLAVQKGGSRVQVVPQQDQARAGQGDQDEQGVGGHHFPFVGLQASLADGEPKPIAGPLGITS